MLIYTGEQGHHEDVVKNLMMGKLSWIIQMGAKCHHRYPSKGGSDVQITYTHTHTHEEKVI